MVLSLDDLSFELWLGPQVLADSSCKGLVVGSTSLSNLVVDGFLKPDASLDVDAHQVVSTLDLCPVGASATILVVEIGVALLLLDCNRHLVELVELLLGHRRLPHERVEQQLAALLSL